ncbi:MAG: nitrite reductase, copper-containing [Chloroflexi bacterium]|nr:nitrite reductase, copper-containing [Chloroflexota bacterium]
MSSMQDQMNTMAGASSADTNPQIEPRSVAEAADVSFTLRADQDGSSLVFIGVGGEIDGIVNPSLNVELGAVVEITLINGMPVEHDLRIDEFGVETGSLKQLNEQRTIKFLADEQGSFSYYCTLPGHRIAGMQGLLIVGSPSQAAEAVSVVKNPADLPAPIGARAPEVVKVELIAREVTGQLDDGATFSYFTFNGSIPGPFIRARVGDTIEITLTNETESAFVHSVDLHAVNGPGGGAVYNQTQPGESKVFTFQALTPGIFVYHCATPSVAHHIANGMYGLILIEPEGGLPPVDREFYVMQGEIYTEEAQGSQGNLTFSHEKMLNETPEWFTFNGAASALASDENALYAKVGERVRIFMGVGGPNFTSSFHVIGEIFDTVYPFGSFTSPPLTDVQTINVNPGAAWAVEFDLDVPGTYILVDHALSRLERGLVGLLYVEGEANPAIFTEGPATQYPARLK